MLVVHGGWVPGAGGPGRLVLWAEDPAMPLTSASRARSRPHPFAVSADMLRAALGEPVVDAAGETATVSLPGTAQGPLPSPEAAAAAAIDTEAGRPPRGLRLAAWAIPVLTVPAEAATPVLATLAEPDPGGSWVAGPSLRYLCLLAGYACDLARRGRMLPQLVVEAGVPAARWRPVLTGADAVTFRDFATGIPPVARAIVTSASGKPAPGNPGAGKPGADQTAGHPAGRIVRETLEALVDVAARDVMPERILAGMRPGPKAPLPDRWLSALTTDDPALPGAPSGEVRELRQALDDWMRAANAANGPIRVSFRLIEPGVESDEWALEFALQSADDPSLYLTAAALWDGDRFPACPGVPTRRCWPGWAGRSGSSRCCTWPCWSSGRPRCR